KLSLGKELEDGSSEEVRGGVPVDVERLGILGGKDLQGSVFFDRAREIEQLVVDLGHDGRIGKARTDFAVDIDGTCFRRDRLFTPVGQSNLDVAHKGNF